MEDVDQEHKVQLVLGSSIKELKQELQNEFQDYKIEIPDENSCLIISKERIALSPILQFLDSGGIPVYEAKEIKLSLEDIFVKVTGIEVNEEKNEEKVGR